MCNCLKISTAVQRTPKLALSQAAVALRAANFRHRGRGRRRPNTGEHETRPSIPAAGGCQKVKRVVAHRLRPWAKVSPSQGRGEAAREGKGPNPLLHCSVAAAVAAACAASPWLQSGTVPQTASPWQIAKAHECMDCRIGSSCCLLAAFRHTPANLKQHLSRRRLAETLCLPRRPCKSTAPPSPLILRSASPTRRPIGMRPPKPMLPRHPTTVASSCPSTCPLVSAPAAPAAPA